MHKLGVDEWLVSAVMSTYMGARTVVRTVHMVTMIILIEKLACIKAWH